MPLTILPPTATAEAFARQLVDLLRAIGDHWRAQYDEAAELVMTGQDYDKAEQLNADEEFVYMAVYELLEGYEVSGVDAYDGAAALMAGLTRACELDALLEDHSPARRQHWREWAIERGYDPDEDDQ
jgi:hypothetical protein